MTIDRSLLGAGSARRLRGDSYVRGAIRYLDDVEQRGLLHLAFLRSPHAHARIRGVRCEAARALEGVVAALTDADVRGAMEDLICAIPSALSGTEGALTLPLLARDRVRYAGEPVALVVAVDERTARRATESIEVDYDVLPPLLDIASATTDGAVVQHPLLRSNVVTASTVSEGDSAAAIDVAPHVLEGRVSMGRSSAVPLEFRGCIARWDGEAERLVVRAALQQPHAFRAELARQLHLPEGDIQVHTPPLGGAFGFKFIGLPEEPLTCLMALRLKRPVRWVENRAEALLIGAREYDAHYRIGFDATGRVLGLSVDLDANVGALCASGGPLMPMVAATTFPGPYDLAHLTVRWRAVTTNKGPWNGARGFGKEATCVILECAMDDVARALGVDPVAVRRRNLLRPDQFPHRTSTMTVDSGNYERALDRVLALSEYERKRARRRDAASGRRTRMGVGLGFELTPEGFDGGGSVSRGFETATVRLDTAGHVTVLTGVTSPGTGSETAIAQLVAGQLGIPHEHVRVVQGDTDATPYGSGSFSSRAVLVGGTAAWLAAGDLREKLVTTAEVLLGAKPGQIEVGAGLYRVAGEPARCIPIGALAHSLRSLGSVLPGLGSPQLEFTRTYGPENMQSIPDATGRVQIYPTYSYSVHVAEVEVDLDTGVVSLLGLAAVHDCGTVINPALVDVQLHGAIAMGVGMALTEEELYDAAGRPQSDSFKRYLLPRVKDLPVIRTDYLSTPSPFTALGTKGAGESGVGGSAAAIISAVRDAIGESDPLPVEIPLTPPRVLARVDHAKLGAAS